MPEYGFRNKITKEEWIQRMGISEMEKFIEENPDIETFPNGAPLIHSGRSLGGGLKVDGGFNDLLKTIKKGNSRGITQSNIETK